MLKSIKSCQKIIHFWLYIMHWFRCTGGIHQYPRINLSLWILFFHHGKHTKHTILKNFGTFPKLTFLVKQKHKCIIRSITLCLNIFRENLGEINTGFEIKGQLVITAAQTYKTGICCHPFLTLFIWLTNSLRTLPASTYSRGIKIYIYRHINAFLWVYQCCYRMEVLIGFQ